MMKVKYYKCHICNKKFKTLNGWGSHIQSSHPDSIPEGYSISRFFYFTKTGKTHGTCRTCKGNTDWNEESMKYNQYCTNPECKKAYVKIAKQRMIGKYGKVHLLNNPDVQRKMLENRKISGKYKFQDGQEFEYVGSYEKEFLKMMDTMLEWPSNDLMAPSPHTYYYEYKNNNDDKKNWGTKFYIPDFYIPSLNLEIEIKQSTSTNKEFIAVMRVKEKLKDEVMTSNPNLNYIKINDNNFTNFFEFLLKAKENIETDDEIKKNQIGAVMESYNTDCEEYVAKESYYRVTYDGEGIYNAYKNKVGFTKWKEFLSNGYSSWLPKPPLNYDKNLSYFTEDGYKKFMSDVMPIMKKSLNSNKIEIDEINDIGKIVYNDKYQVVTESSTNTPQQLYFLSRISMDDEIIKPRIPDNFMTKHGYEDNKTPRVCFAPSIDQCLMALSQKCKGFELYVHVPEDINKKYVKYPTKKEVPDVDITGEVWITKPVTLQCIGKIKVIGDAGEDGIEYTYGDKTAELYKWNWKWLYKFDENHNTVVCESCRNVQDARKLVTEVTQLAKKYNANFFFVTDGASGYSNGNGGINNAAKLMREKMDEWELKNGYDPKENWANESVDRTFVDTTFKSKGIKHLSDFQKIKVTKNIINQYKNKIPSLRCLLDFPDNSKNISYLFLDGGKYVGTCSVCPDKFYGDGWHTKEYNVIHNLEISKPYRGYSLGKQMLDFAVNELDGNAMCVYDDNEIAKLIYKKYGFEEVEKSKADIDSGFSDRCFMVLENTLINNNELSPATESLFINKGIFDIHFDKFESGETNVVLITGLSGSGKTTLGSKIASKYNAELIELDLFEQCYIFENDDQLKQCGEVFYQYLSSHKVLWEKLKRREIRGKELGIEIDKFLKYVISWCKKYKLHRYVIEGVQIYEFLNKEKITGVSLLIVGTSALKSLVRRLIRARDNSKEDFKNQLKELPQCIAWYIDENKMFEKFKNSVLESYLPIDNMTTESYHNFSVSYDIPRIVKTWGVVDNKGLYNACLKVSGFDKPLRGRSEMLVIDDDKIFLAFNKDGSYTIPGGGWERNENHMDSAIRETREEVRINVKNVRPASVYITYADQPKNWVMKTVPEKDWWYGCYTEVYIAEYESKYIGNINEYDKDSMIKVGKFYKISDVYDNLLDIHKNAISDYMTRFQNSERSFAVTENNVVDNSAPVIATEGLLNIFNIFKKEKSPVPSWKEVLLSPKGLFGGKVHSFTSLFTGARIVNGMIEIRGINYRVLSNRIEKMYVDKSINNIFVPEYNALSYKKYEKKQIQKKQIKIDYLYTPEFFALELVCLFRDLGKRFNDKVYKSIANQIYENSWLFVADRKSEETSLLDTKNLSNISLELEPHQLEFVQNYPKLKAQLNLNGYILAFEQGLGKTLTSTALAECLDVDHVYIVCPNSLKENWALELRKYYKKYEDDDLWKSEVFICNNKSFLFDPNVTKFIITNNESIDKMFPYVMSGKNMLILDESHNFRNINSKRVTQLLELRDKLKCSDTLIMSGTPIKATPDEIVPALMMIDPTFTMEAAKIFAKAFKLKESLGTTLVQTRFGRIMYRKDKSVMENKLPEKHVEPLLVTTTGSDKYLMENVRSVIMDRFAAIYKEGEKEMKKLREPFFNLADKFAKPTFDEKTRFHKIVNEFTQLFSSEIHEVDRDYVTNYIARAKGNMKSNDDKKYMDFLTKNYLRYRQHCLGVAMGEILPKYRKEMFISMYNDNCDKFYKMINENTKKTLIFSQFKDVVTHIYNDLNNVGIGSVMINGDVTNRMEILQEFKENDSIMVLVATSQTIGTGVTLTEASQMFFFGPPWRQADFDQCSDRIHRIGQTDDVYIYNVVLNTGSSLNLSTRMDDILQWSKKMTDAVITTTDNSEIDDVNFDNMLFASESVTQVDINEFVMEPEEKQLNVYKEVSQKLLPYLIEYHEFFNGYRAIAKESIPVNYILEREAIRKPLDSDDSLKSLKFSKLGTSVFHNPDKNNFNVKFEYHNDNGYEYWDIVTLKEIRKGTYLSYSDDYLIEGLPSK